MLRLNDEQTDEFAAVVASARGRADVRALVLALYDDLAGEIAVQRPRCNSSGRCCHFDAYGHRLFITALEMSVFVDALRLTDRSPQVSASRLRVLSDTGGACPLMRERLCSVHHIRPFGCRIYFCDPSSVAWQQDAYERFHTRLRQAHQPLGVKYLYCEWREALRAMGSG